MKLHVTGTLLLAVLTLHSTAVLAQQPRAAETIEVSIVNMDVQVTDKQGRRVSGLTANDFEIREEGRLQPITNFAEYKSRSTTLPGSETLPASIELAGTPRPQRTIVVFVEASAMKPAAAKSVYDSLREMLRATVSPGDRVTIAQWKGSLQVRQAFTDDLAVLNDALTAMEEETPHAARRDAREIRFDQDQSRAAEAEFVAAFNEMMAIGAPPTATPNVIPTSGLPPIHSLSAAKQQLLEISRKAIALEALMQSVSAFEGRKIMIMAMRRLGTYAGAEYFGDSIPFDRLSELDTVALRESIIRTANAHGITLYPIYPAGLEWDPDDASVGDVPAGSADANKASMENKILLNETATLREIAMSTGGLVAWGSADIASMIPRLAEDLEAYYSLAYRARSTGKDVTRRIVVRTKDPRYEVRSRKHFVEKSDHSRMSDRVIAALYQQLGGSTLTFDVGAGEIRALGRNRWSVPLKVRIPIAGLTMLPEGSQHTGEFSLYLVTGASVGVMSEVERRTQPFHIAQADLKEAKGSYFTYNVTVQVDDRIDRFSIGIVDEVSKEFGLKRFLLPELPEK